MKLKLRPYQQRAVDQALERLRAGDRVCCVGPTGAGKTACASAIVDALCADTGMPGSALVLAPSRALAAQLGERVGGHAKTVHWFLAAEQRGRASLVRRMRSLSVLVLDECHRFVATQRGWDLPHQLAREAGVPVVGFTATPQRGDGAPLAAYFDSMVKIADYTELVDQGFLVPSRVIEVFPKDGLDGKRVKSEGRSDIVSTVLKVARGLSTLVFVEDTAVVQATVDGLRAAGDSAEGLTGETPDEERDAAFARFMSGETRVLVNAALLTEGIDLPRTECVVLSRTCAHACSYLQIAGRGLRPSPGKKELLFVDMVGVAREFGTPHQDRQYSLHGLAISGGGEADVLCGQCYRGVCSWQLSDEAKDTIVPRPLTEEDLCEARSWVVDDIAERAENGDSKAAQRRAEGAHRKRIAKLTRAVGDAVSILPPRPDFKNGCIHCADRKPRGKSLVDARELDGAMAEELDLGILDPASDRAGRIRALIDARHKKRGKFPGRSMLNLLVVSRYNRTTKEYDDHPGDWKVNYPNDEPLTMAEVWSAATDKQRDRQRQYCLEHIRHNDCKFGYSWFHVGAFEKAAEARRSA